MTQKFLKSSVATMFAFTALLWIPQSRAQTPAPPAAAATVAGKWHFVLDTEGGDREVNAEFSLDGQKVTGKWGKADVKGTFTDGKLMLEFPYDSDEVGPGTMKIVGSVVGDGMTGTWAFQSYDGTLKASRTS